MLDQEVLQKIVTEVEEIARAQQKELVEIPFKPIPEDQFVVSFMEAVAIKLKTRAIEIHVNWEFFTRG